MLLKFKKIISALLVSVILITSSTFLSVSGASQSQLQQEINRLEEQSKKLESEIKSLKKQNADQQSIVNAIENKISNTQSQIDACNNEINKINSTIASNDAEIDAKNKEIADMKLLFKKRLRAIHMNNTSSSVQVLMGAKNFSHYLQLEELTSAVSAHDKKIIEEIYAAIELLNKKQEENKKLLNEQISVKNSIVKKQQQLQSEEAEASKILSSINAQTNDLTKQNKDIEAQIKKAQQELDSLFNSYGTNSSVVYDGTGFKWPVPSCFTQTTYAGHSGIDIPGAYGAPIYASAAGKVITVVTGHGRNPGATGLASYGNYVIIDHGNLNGVNYKTCYAHMSTVSVSVGQTVNQGTLIGGIGNSGNTWGRTGTHLHFEIRVNNSARNPNSYLKK